MLGFLIEIRKDASKIILDTRSKKEKNMKAVLQYNQQGEKIGEYPSISSAERETGIYNISECILEKRQSAGGYIWKAAD